MSEVTLPLTAEQIAAYVATGEPMGKAGAYGIQGARRVHSGAAWQLFRASWACRCTRQPSCCVPSASLCEIQRISAMAAIQQDILINWSPQETRVAVVEHGAVQELHIERTLERGLVGNVYLGKVSRVLPGMQSAFIDIGLERAAFACGRCVAPPA